MSGFALFGLVYLVAMLIIWHRPLINAAKARLDRRIGPITQLVLEMLERSDGWSFTDSYRATHETGASIWIGSKPASAALTLEGRVQPHGSDPTIEVKTNLRERHALYAAAIALREQAAADQHRVKVAEWASRVETYADNVVQLGGKR